MKRVVLLIFALGLFGSKLFAQDLLVLHPPSKDAFNFTCQVNTYLETPDRLERIGEIIRVGDVLTVVINDRLCYLPLHETVFSLPPLHYEDRFVYTYQTYDGLYQIWHRLIFAVERTIDGNLTSLIIRWRAGGG